MFVYKEEQDAGYFLVVHSYYVGNWEEGCGAREHRVLFKSKNEDEANAYYQDKSEEWGDLSLTEDTLTLVWPTNHRHRFDEETPWGEDYCRCGKRKHVPCTDEVPF